MTSLPQSKEEAKHLALEYLDPLRLQKLVVHMGFFLLAFEQLRSIIIEKPKSFFSDRVEVVNGKFKVTPSEEYREKVLSLADKELEAALRWHERMGGIDEDDTADILRLLNYRNLIAHEPHRILNNHDNPLYQADAIDRVRRHHRKIGNFWGRNEADFDLNLDGKDIDYDGIVLGATLLLDYMAEILSGQSAQVGK